MNLKQITDKNPEALKNRAVLKAMINDAFPEERKGLVNAVVTVLDCGIAAKMKGGASQADIDRYTDILCDDYAYVKEVAEECIRLWCEVFSIKFNVNIPKNTGAENKVQINGRTQNNVNVNNAANVNNTNKQVKMNNPFNQGIHNPGLAKNYKVSNDPRIGSFITMGAFEQGKSKTVKPLRWIIINTDGDNALLLSESSVGWMPFEEFLSKAEWDTSTLKRWVNNDFYNKAFNASEKNKIINFTGYDRVFLLSRKEIAFYSEKILSLQNPMSDYGADWWLRDGGISDYAEVCYGKNYSGSRKAGEPKNVRPAIWVDLTK